MARQYLKQLQVANVERQRKAAVTLQRYVYKSTISSFPTSESMDTLKFRGGGYSWEFLVGVCRPVLQILTIFQTKKCHFPHPFSNLFFRQKLCHHYLDYSANKKFLKSIPNSHISLSFLLIWNWNVNAFIHSRSSLENHTRFQTKMGKVYIPVFRPVL